MSSPFSVSLENPLIAYLRQLREDKPTLPYGQLICVSASPKITTTSALLRLAHAVGPYIAVLQVHADIIDDWSLKTARRLTCLAKKFGFLVWEGGRVLNTQRCSSKAQSMSEEEITRSIDMARKRYTKGVVSVAAWAGLASTWVIGPGEQRRGANRLIPVLRQAAKEAVALTTMSVRTEISAGETPVEAFAGTVGDEVDDDNEEQSKDQYSGSHACRKASVISLTRTITQHTELSTPGSPCDEEERDSDFEPDVEMEISFPASVTPAPPLLSRGLIVCLPTGDEVEVTPLYKKAAIAAAKEHSDFVVGFSTEESWLDVCRRQEFPRCLDMNECDVPAREPVERNRGPAPTLSTPSPETYVVFSPLEDGHLVGSDPSISSSEEYISSPQQRSHSQQIGFLLQLVARAVAIKNAHIPAGQDNAGSCSHDILYIPVITMSA
ncbi:hypothetical protein VTO42DRAFT_5977 [Malbranchea cinnamomea]